MRMVEEHAKRMPGKVSVTRVRTLLEEIRPKASINSKWDSYERIGQAELYDACEKALDSLRNYKQHSFPFINKVTKREAPDYLDG
jgi:transcriptional activator SPT7